MNRATAAEHVRRLNLAVNLLKHKATPQAAAAALVGRCHLSQRQAYRYVEQAQQIEQRLPLPETKVVFTVKLPKRLVARVRRQARRRGQSISDWVGQALELGLTPKQRNG